MKHSIKKFIIIFIVALFYICFITNARNYNVNNSNIETDLDCWIGWKEWHFGATSPKTKKGDPITYYRRFINKDGIEGYYKSDGITNGYGHYALDFGKHILGLLSFMKNKITDYPTTYVPIYDQPEFDKDGKLKEPEAVKIRDAIEITIGKLLRTWYSKDYEKNEFSLFWDNGIKLGNEDELKTLQNNFYWQAYGKEAFKVLIRMMGESYDNLSPKQKMTLKGVLFSIMEARYRNKNLQGKANLTLKAAEGEILPFLVNLKNINFIVREGESGYYRYKDTRKGKGYDYYEFPTFDEIIDGAYLWMEYYDKDIIASTTHSTITISLNNNYETEEVDIDWSGEYQDLTDEVLNELYGQSLDDFYDRCYKVRNLFKKSIENAEGIFGAEEIYDITSDVNFSQALENMKNKIIEFCNGVDFGSVWTGLTDYNIERTYMMAKNIMESNKVKDEYAYYNIGTNIITYTPGLSGKEIMLMDLQKIELKQPLEVIENGRIEKTKEDSDNDGILDRNELGDATSNSDIETTMKIKVDITGFIKKAVEKELYGNNQKEINKNQAYIKEVVSKVKFNIYNQRNKFDKENSENNKLNWKEVYENNLNVDEETKRALNILDTDTAKEQYLKITPSKLEVELWKYKSNPVLKDTDFDGIEDGFGYERDSEGEYLYVDDKKVHMELNAYKDKTPKDNYFTGKMHTTRLSGDNAIKVDINMDYRYFFMSNKLYFDELSTMSLLYANSIYRKGEGQSMHSGLQLKSGNNFISEEDKTKKTYKKEEIENMDLDKFNNMQVKEMMEHFGFKDVKTYYMGEPGGKGDENKEYFYDKFSVKEDEIVKVRIPESEEDKNYQGIGKKYKNIDEIYLGYKDTHKGRVAIGYKNIEYHGLNKTVIGVVIRGTAEDDDWDSDFDMGDLRIKELIDKNGRKDYFGYDGDLQKLGYDMQYREELNHFIDGYDDWIWDYHHAGFDIVSNRILKIVKEYYDEVEKHFDDDVELFDGEENIYVDGGVCFWVTGHSMGAGVANLVASSLICSDNIDIIRGIGGNADNVYCYTFAAPNTFYRTDSHYKKSTEIIPGENVTGKYAEPKGIKYRCIFNIVNDDDFVPKLPMEECEWTKYGRVAEYSIENKDKNIYSRRQSNSGNTLYMDGDYRKYIANMYQSNNYEMNSLINELSSIYLHTTQMRKCTYLFDRNGEKIEAKRVSIDNILNTNKNARPYQRISRYKNNIEIPFINKNINIDLPLEAGVANVQSQMPAYFMQCIAHSMHTYLDDENAIEGIANYIDSDKTDKLEIIAKKFNFKIKGIIFKDEDGIWKIKFDGKKYNINQAIFKFTEFADEYKQAHTKLIDTSEYLEFPHYLESYYILTKKVSTVNFK